MQEVNINEMLDVIPVRKRDGHKGDYGHVLIVGGSEGFGGAPALAAYGAVRTGAGLVTVATPRTLLNGAVASLVPEAMCHPIDCGADGRLKYSSFSKWYASRKNFDVVVVGPGLGQSDDTLRIVHKLLLQLDLNLVLDADALNLISSSQELMVVLRKAESGKRVLTPHAGEAARLLGCSADEINNNRDEAVKKLAELTGAIVILKGAGSLICEVGNDVQICNLGNPGMATGGSGDVLSGIIVGLWGQGVSGFDAARFGVWLHGKAGDLAAEVHGEASVIARDIGDYIGIAMGGLTPTS